MPHTITVSPDRAFVILTVTGEINGTVAYQQNVEAHALGNELGINRYLVDVTEARNTDSILGNYDFAYDKMTASEVDQMAIVAMLVTPGDHSHDFVEIAAKNSGLHVTRFTDRTLAEEHLRRGLNPQGQAPGRGVGS